VAGSIAVALIVFGASCKLLRVEEFSELLGTVRLSSKQAPRATKPSG